MRECFPSVASQLSTEGKAEKVARIVCRKCHANRVSELPKAKQKHDRKPPKAMDMTNQTGR
jgi:cytochrome c5